MENGNIHRSCDFLMKNYDVQFSALAAYKAFCDTSAAQKQEAERLRARRCAARAGLVAARR